MKNYENPLVFIVEDNEVYAEMIQYNVQKRNFETEIYYSGEACIKNLYKNPDIIILDYMLDKINGLDVLKQVKAINPDIHVIFLSGQDDLNVGIDSLKYGAFDYVLKDAVAFDNVIIALNEISKLTAVLKKQTRLQKFKKRAAVIGISATIITFLFQYML